MNMIQQDVIDEYDLTAMVHKDEYCYAEIRKVMYGLREAGYIANMKLKRVLGLEGYLLSKFTPGLFTHKTRDMAFLLIVDNFGVWHTKREDVQHLLKTIQDRYPIKVDWDPTFYSRVALEFDYDERTCKMLIPGYVKQALINFHHEFNNATHSPSPFKAPVYGQKIQIATINKTNSMTTVQTKLLQEVCGTFLYYARAVNCTILHGLNDLATRSKEGTQKIVKALNHFLDYFVTHPEAVVLY